MRKTLVFFIFISFLDVEYILEPWGKYEDNLCESLYFVFILKYYMTKTLKQSNYLKE